MTKLYIDIETIPSEEKPSFEEIEVPKNYKDSEKIWRYKEQKQEELYRAQALDSMKGRILCIGYAIEDNPAEVIYEPDDEEQLLRKFSFVVTPLIPGRLQALFYSTHLDKTTGVLSDVITWVGHNIRNFDLQWLYRHALRAREEMLAATIPRKRYAKNVIDTMELWAGPDFRDYAKLEDIAKFLELGEKKDNVNGGEVYDYWLTGRHEEIQEYCKQDVELTRKIYKRISFEG